MSLFKNKKNFVQKDIFYSQVGALEDLIKQDDVKVKTSPTYRAALQLLSNELARFAFTISGADRFKNILQSARVVNRVLNSSYEVLRYIYSNLLDTGRVAIVVYDKIYIFNKDQHEIYRNKNNEYMGIIVNNAKIAKENVIVIYLSDAADGGFRDWLKDVIDLERYLISYMGVYTKSFGLFGAWKINNADVTDEKSFALLQSMLAIARRKMQAGAMPVLPGVVESLQNEKMGWEGIQIVQNFITKTIARMMGIPLLMLQAREGGAYALAKEERASWYETSLQGYAELVRSALESWLREHYDPRVSVFVDTTGMDYLNEKREWTAQEIATLLASQVINTDEARRLLGVDVDLKNNKAKETVKKQASVKYAKTDNNKKEVVENELTIKEDELVWEWHEKNIQPLEGFARSEILANVNKALERELKDNITMQQSFKADDKEEDNADINNINVSSVVNIIERAIYKALVKIAKRAVVRTLRLNSYVNKQEDDVFINPEILYEGLELMLKESVKFINKETATLVADKLKEMRESGNGYNWKDVVEELQKTCMTKERAERIARTEINRAACYTQERKAEEMQKIAETSGRVLLKRWSTARDEKVRKSHVEAGMVGWIKFNEKFPNGLDRPYSENAPAGEIVNCRCGLVTKLVRKNEEVEE